MNLNKLGPTLVLLAILSLGFGLRLYRLGDQSIWWDEGHAVWTARQSLRQVTDITAHDVHPPLYLWMLHGWLSLVGESEFALRYMSLIGGMLTTSLTYVIARRLIGRRAAMLATLLIATARFHIWWSQEARMYVWATFFAMLSIYFFTRLRHKAGTWRSYVMASVAAMYTLYLSILVLFLENLFVAITAWHKPHRRRFLYRWGVSQLSILILYSPWLYMALLYSRTDTSSATFSFYDVWQLYGAVLVTGISTDLHRYTWLLVAFGVLALAGILLLFFDRRQPQRYGFAGWEIGLLLSLPLVIPPLVVYGLSIPRGVFYSPKPEARYLLLFAPLFYILMAGTIAGFWQQGRRGRAVTIIAIVLVLGSFVSVLPEYYVGRYLRDDYQTAMATLDAYAAEDDAVLVVSGDRYPIFMYHYNRRFPDGQGPTVYLMPRHSTRFAPDNIEAELAPLSEQHEQLWLASFERTLQDPDNLVEGWLDTHRTPVLQVSQGHNYLRLYANDGARLQVTPAALSPQHPFDRPFLLGKDTRIRGYDLLTTEFRPGDVVRPGLYVEVTGQLDLVADWIHADGQVIERQSIPLDGLDRVMPAFAVYGYTPPGRYWIEFYAAGDDTARVRIPAGRITKSRKLPDRKIEVEQRASLGDGSIELLGYTVRPSARVRAGRALTVDLFWRAQRPVDGDYTVFVHLLGPYNPATGGPLWAQDDSYPMEGGHPTSRWLPGQVVPDRHRLDIPADMPPGGYQIEIGLYDASTGVRLALDQGTEDRILLNNVQVIEP